MSQGSASSHGKLFVAAMSASLSALSSVRGPSERCLFPSLDDSVISSFVCGRPRRLLGMPEGGGEINDEGKLVWVDGSAVVTEVLVVHPFRCWSFGLW